MESGLILLTAAVTITWSLRSYLNLSGRAEMAEDSPLRLLNIIAPSAYFLVLLFAGWSGTGAIRLDLLGLIALDGVAVLSFAFSFVIAAIPHPRQRTSAIGLFAVYHLLSIVVVAATFAIRTSPVLLIRASSIIERISEIDVLSFAWVGLDSEGQQQDIVAFLNRILVAVLSYVPIALLRLFTSIRYRRRMEREVERLKRRVSAIEALIDRSEM